MPHNLTVSEQPVCRERPCACGWSISSLSPSYTGYNILAYTVSVYNTVYIYMYYICLPPSTCTRCRATMDHGPWLVDLLFLFIYTFLEPFSYIYICISCMCGFAPIFHSLCFGPAAHVTRTCSTRAHTPFRDNHYTSHPDPVPPPSAS